MIGADAIVPGGHLIEDLAEESRRGKDVGLVDAGDLGVFLPTAARKPEGEVCELAPSLSG